MVTFSVTDAGGHPCRQRPVGWPERSAVSLAGVRMTILLCFLHHRGIAQRSFDLFCFAWTYPACLLLLCLRMNLHHAFVLLRFQNNIPEMFAVVSVVISALDGLRILVLR